MPICSAPKTQLTQSMPQNMRIALSLPLNQDAAAAARQKKSPASIFIRAAFVAIPDS